MINQFGLGIIFEPMRKAIMGFNLGGLFGGGKKSRNEPQTFTPPPFTGERPYTGADVGLGAEAIKPLSEQYLRQLLERSRGEGLVGFDPRRREVLRSEFTQDLGQAEDEQRRRQQAQASGQGLRGGVPLTISEQRARDFSRARASGLADIDIEDLAARRQDINAATYAQPEAVRLGSGIQAQRGQFDLAAHVAGQPQIIAPQQAAGPDLGGLFSSLGNLGSIFAPRSRPAQGIGEQVANRSIQRSPVQNDPFLQSRQVARRF